MHGVGGACFWLGFRLRKFIERGDSIWVVNIPGQNDLVVIWNCFLEPIHLPGLTISNRKHRAQKAQKNNNDHGKNIVSKVASKTIWRVRGANKLIFIISIFHFYLAGLNNMHMFPNILLAAKRHGLSAISRERKIESLTKLLCKSLEPNLIICIWIDCAKSGLRWHINYIIIFN